MKLFGYLSFAIEYHNHGHNLELIWSMEVCFLSPFSLHFSLKSAAVLCGVGAS